MWSVRPWKQQEPGKYISQKPEATEEAGGGAPEARNAEAAKPESRAPKFMVFADPSNMNEFDLPTIDIVAVHDLEQKVTTAWTYTKHTVDTKSRLKGLDRNYPGESHERRGMNYTQERLAPGIRNFSAVEKIASSLNASSVALRDEAPMVTVSRPGATLKDKGKVIDEVYRRAPAPAHPSQQQVGPLGDDDLISHYSNRPPSSKGSKSLSQMESKPGNWLTDLTTFATGLDKARVFGFPYDPPTKLNEDESLKVKRIINNAAEGILYNLREARQGSLSSIPLVFIATGFGCLIIQRFIALISESEKESSSILDMIAAVIFFDAPNPIMKDHYRSEAGFMEPKFPLPTSSRRIARVKTFLESGAIDSWDLWRRFHNPLKERALSIVWYYTAAEGTSQTVVSPDTESVKFIRSAKSMISRSRQRFTGQADPSYRSFIREIQDCLILNASSNTRLNEFLRELIEHYSHNLDALGVRDQQQRCPLHRAAGSINEEALRQLIVARPDLVIAKDKDGRTPLHLAVIGAAKRRLKGESRLPFQIIIEALLNELARYQLADYESDKFEKSPWDYASAHQWIQELREDHILHNEKRAEGARASRPETIHDLIAQSTATGKRANACRLSNAYLTQFYIEQTESDRQDSLYPQRPNLYTAIYDEKYGAEKLFRLHLINAHNTWETCKWIHLPANNEKWVHDLFLRQFACVDDSTTKRRHRGSAPFDRHLAPGVDHYNQNYDYSSREIPYNPSLNTDKNTDEPDMGKRTVTALFMPVFGFETDINRRKLSEQMRRASSAPIAATTAEDFHADTDDGIEEDDRNSLLIQAYLGDKFPLHCRRTLDQYTYHMMGNTETRDTTQVMFKWQKELGNIEKTDAQNFPLLMVDQLWLWVLEEDEIVITSLPNTWESLSSYNLIQYFRKQELTGNNHRQLIESPKDLANLIIRSSVDCLHRKGPLGATINETFQSSITAISWKNEQRFQNFVELAKRLAGDIGDQEKTSLTNSLFQQTAETTLLVEIIDIKDELNTILKVFLEQKDVLRAFASALANNKSKNDIINNSDDIPSSPKTAQDDPTSPTTSGRFRSDSFEPNQSASHRNRGRLSFKRSTRHYDKQLPYLGSNSRDQAEDNLQLVLSNIATIEELIVYAERVQAEIEALLDRTQKHANAWEARFAREGSEHSRYQSNITLVFTIVTVFFLPLSFISSVFAIQIDVFPHDEQTGELNWPLNQALGLLFGISFGVIFLVAFLGFYINKISRFCRKHLNRAQRVLARRWRGWFEEEKKEKVGDVPFRDVSWGDSILPFTRHRTTTKHDPVFFPSSTARRGGQYFHAMEDRPRSPGERSNVPLLSTWGNRIWRFIRRRPTTEREFPWGELRSEMNRPGEEHMSFREDLESGSRDYRSSKAEE
ncbi:hypothetical protein F4777DRAFT_43189 [Nemania sp. FL0916]|nr:hypothetical protein F4777DRAFT_43189 [Nemania sp. FL0916]